MSSLEYPFAELPAPGTTLKVAPGVHWLRMPLPFQLDHINLWLLEDDAGWTMVDTGIGNAATRELWEKVFGSIEDFSVKRVVVTHYHPDHAGNAAWLCERFGVELWMTQGEYLTAHAVRAGGAGYTSEAVLRVLRKNGLDEARRAAMATRTNRYALLVPDFPHSYRRLIEGDRVRIGGRGLPGAKWQLPLIHAH